MKSSPGKMGSLEVSVTTLVDEVVGPAAAAQAMAADNSAIADFRGMAHLRPMLGNRKPTDFEMLVYEIVRKVPQGKVTTYGRITKLLGRGTARSVGTALSKNPFAPEVPCHRVVRADGSLGGFDGHTSGPRLQDKRRMLEEEGVVFLPDGRVAASCRAEAA